MMGLILKPAYTMLCKSQKCVSTNAKKFFLFGLKFTEAPSASNWMARSIDNYETLRLVLPKIFKELDQIPLDQPYNFLMSLDRNSIDKETARLGVEALMF